MCSKTSVKRAAPALGGAQEISRGASRRGVGRRRSRGRWDTAAPGSSGRPMTRASQAMRWISQALPRSALAFHDEAGAIRSSHGRRPCRCRPHDAAARRSPCRAPAARARGRVVGKEPETHPVLADEEECRSRGARRGRPAGHRRVPPASWQPRSGSRAHQIAVRPARVQAQRRRQNGIAAPGDALDQRCRVRIARCDRKKKASQSSTRTGT